MFTIPQVNSGATELSPLLGSLPSCSQGAVQGCSWLKAPLGKEPLPSSLPWSLAGFSSSWAVGLKALISLPPVGRRSPLLSSLAHRPLRRAAPNMDTGFISANKREESWRVNASKMEGTFCNSLIPIVTFSHSCHILFMKSKSLGPDHPQRGLPRMCGMPTTYLNTCSIFSITKYFGMLLVLTEIF